jgi:large subunit ribosomal protein L17
MRHQKHHASLGVTREHRAAMMANMSASLIKKGRIQTTLTKAKALRPFIEKVITLAKNGTLHDRRRAMARVRDEDAVTLLFNEKVQEFTKRSGGYTRIYKLGLRRISDAAEMALIEFIKGDDQGYKKSKGKKSAKAKAPKAEPAAEAAAPEAGA